MSRSLLTAALLTGAIACFSPGCSDTKRDTKRRDNAPPQTPAVPSTQRAATGAQVPAVEKSLFDRLGGTAGITKVVDDFVAIAAEDPKVNFTRKGHSTPWDATPENVAHLKKRLVEFLATTTGGDVNYSGKDMVGAHKGMAITDAEFDAAASDLKKALDKHDIPAPEQAELLAVVNKTRAAIVEDRAERNAPGSTQSQPKPEASMALEPVQTFTPGPSSSETELEPAPDDLNK